MGRYTCTDGSHYHISKKERDTLMNERAIEVVVAPRVFMMPMHAIRGFSASMGEAIALLKNNALKQLLVSEINRRPMEDVREAAN